MDYDYEVTKKNVSSLRYDQGGEKFVDALVREFNEEHEILNEYSRSFSFQTPEEVEDGLLQVFRPISLQEGVEGDIVREAVNLAYSLEYDTINNVIDVKVSGQRQDISESDSDSDEEDQPTEAIVEEYVMQPTPASEEAIEALEEITLEAPIECSICRTLLNVGQWGTRLPSYHTFHHYCIVPWLRQKNTCPVCRDELPEA